MRGKIILAVIMGIFLMLTTHANAYSVSVSWENAASEGVSVHHSDLNSGWVDTTNTDWSNLIISMDIWSQLRFDFNNPIKDVSAKVRFGYDFGNFVGYAPAILDVFDINNNLLGKQVIKTYQNQFPIDLAFSSSFDNIKSIVIYSEDDVGVYVGDISINSAPEPTTIALLCAGLLMLIISRKKILL